MTKNKIIVCLLLILSVSCAPEKNSNPLMPDIGIPVSENGEFIKLEIPEGWNSLSQTEPIALRVTNISDETLLFQPDFGAMLFIFQENKWVEIENIIGYSLSSR